MNEVTFNILSSAFRFVWIAVTTHGIAILTMNMMLERKRSQSGMIIYMVIKILLVNTFLGVIVKDFFNEFYTGNMWIQVIQTLGIMSASVITFLVFVYTYEGELVQVVVASLISELASVFTGYFSLVIVNFWSGRAVFTHAAVFEAKDLGIPIIAFSIFFLFRYCLHSQLTKFREYNFKHKKIILCIFVLYIAAATFETIKTSYHTATMSYSAFCLLFGFFIVLLFQVKRYDRNMKEERGALEMQLQLLKRHYKRVEEQVKLAETSRKATNIQIREVTALTGDAVELNRISVYKDALIRAYQKLKPGMYCDDWVLDAVFSSQAELMEQYNIDMQCSMQEYRETGDVGVEKQDLISLILSLINWGIRSNSSLKQENKWMRFCIATVKNQIIVEYAASWDGKEPIAVNMFRKYNRKYEKIITIQKKKAEIKLTMALWAGGQ